MNEKEKTDLTYKADMFANITFIEEFIKGMHILQLSSLGNKKDAIEIHKFILNATAQRTLENTIIDKERMDKNEDNLVFEEERVKSFNESIIKKIDRLIDIFDLTKEIEKLPDDIKEIDELLNNIEKDKTINNSLKESYKKTTEEVDNVLEKAKKKRNTKEIDSTINMNTSNKFELYLGEERVILDV